jgi:type I restriction enzyme R subunit
MSGHGVTENVVEELVLELLAELGWTRAYGPDLAPDGDIPERSSHEDVVLEGRLRAALVRLNPGVSSDGIDEALRRVLYLDVPGLLSANRAFHKMLCDGVEVEVQRDGLTRGEFVRLIDAQKPDDNDWLAVNQLTVVNGTQNGSATRDPTRIATRDLTHRVD